MYKSIMPNIMVENVVDTIKFYVEKLGFNVIVTFPEKSEVIDFAMIIKDNVTISFQSKKSLIEEYEVLKTDVIKSSFTLYIKVDKIDELYNNLKDTVKIEKEIHNTFYGAKEFAILDINNNILTIAE